nr:penicillin-binding transpeptidase domain-containing protein [Mobilitalea sibirica]
MFVLQIVQGPSHAEEFDLKQTKNREIKSTRGNFYDRNGILLASNMLTYSVTMEDSNEITSNEQRNKVIHKLINIIEDQGDTLDNEFYIIQTEDGEFDFTISGSALTRFKKNVYTYMLENNQLTEAQQKASAKEVYEFLRKGTGDNYTTMFNISDEYSVDETLKIMSVRYALLSNYPKFVQITVASQVSDTTVAAVLENSADLPGVEIQQQTHRVYHDSLYFSHILGYTGLISAQELEDLDDGSDYYNSTDIIGKSGLEKEYEKELGGKKGNETVTVNIYGKVTDVVDREDPIAGNDVYLTIDSNLQRAAYHMLENKIAGILVEKLQPDMNYGSKGESAADILLPVYEVYFALINNNVIDITAFDDRDATSLEKQVYQKYSTRLNQVFDQFDTYLDSNNTVTNSNSGDMEDYLIYYYQVLKDYDILLSKDIPADDPVYKSYINDRTSLSNFLQHAIASNYIDLSKLNVGEEYYSSEELYQKLLDYTKDILLSDDKFNKKIYRDLVFSYKLSGTEICLLLFDQNVLKSNKDENDLKSGRISAFNFIKDKMTNLEITPAMLALEPYSGSVVVTDVKTGDILAMVTYPSYDNNRLANKVDAEYYKKLLDDLTKPLLNRATSTRTAPGSTFKMVTSFAALEEGVTTPYEKIRDLGIFEKINPAAKCHIYPHSHGSVDIVDALKVSCNYYYYEMGFRLSIDSTGKFNEKLGLEKLQKYAAMFGLDHTSGIELYEAIPNVSDKDSVRSSIGQGSNDYTPVQLARYVTTLANRGINYDLTLLDKITNKDGDIIRYNRAKIYNDLTNIKSSTWDSVQKGMYAVANESGGSVNRLFSDFSVTVAGKTGTSQISKVNPNNALFVSYAPFENPEISVTSVIPNGYTSSNAAELTKDIYKVYFNLEDPDDLVKQEASVPDSNIASYLE